MIQHSYTSLHESVDQNEDRDIYLYSNLPEVYVFKLL